ncbi:sugar transferase, partial [Streptomyces sp. NPDC002530]
MGLAGAPRPRTSSHRLSGPATDRPPQGPTVQRDRSARTTARTGTGRRLPLGVTTDLLGLGVPGWLVLRAGAQPSP